MRLKGKEMFHCLDSICISKRAGLVRYPKLSYFKVAVNTFPFLTNSLGYLPKQTIKISKHLNELFPNLDGIKGLNE